MRTTTILVVCGAGASSTFVAQRLSRAAQASGLDWDCSAGALDAVAWTGADVVLLGPHLAERTADIRARTGARVVPLPDDVFTDRAGERTLALVRSSLIDSSTELAENTEKGIS